MRVVFRTFLSLVFTVTPRATLWMFFPHRPLSEVITDTLQVCLCAVNASVLSKEKVRGFSPPSTPKEPMSAPPPGATLSPLRIHYAEQEILAPRACDPAIMHRDSQPHGPSWTPLKMQIPPPPLCRSWSSTRKESRNPGFSKLPGDSGTLAGAEFWGRSEFRTIRGHLV